MHTTRAAILVVVLISLLPAARATPMTTGSQWSPATLGLISEFASTNCPLPAMNGSESSVGGSAEVKFSIPSLLKKLADLGATIKGQAHSSNYNGVTQEKLADALKDSMHCREILIQLVFDRVLPPESSAPADAIEIVEASMTTRGGDATRFDPSQHYVHGIAHVVYTGKGPYTTNFFTACLTTGSQAEETSTCFDNSEFPQPYPGSGPKTLEIGSHVYRFVVYLPGNQQLPKTPQDVQVMVCILDVAHNSFFAQPREQRFVQPHPICDVRTVKFQD